MRILLLGLTNKSGLAVARNLTKYGCTVDAIYLTEVAAKHSRYIDKCYSFGNPELDVNAYSNRLLEHLRSNKYDGIIPIHDAALEICRYKQKEISALVKIGGLNPDDIYKYSGDKHEMLQIGEANGLLIPKSYWVDSLEAFYDLDLSHEKFPLVAKPVSSAKIVNNKLYGFSVSVCHNIEELTDFIRENINLVNILIQEFVEGYGVGYNFIALNGIIQNAYIHRRLNENAGVSSLRESLSPDHYGLQEKLTAVVKSMQWSGVGMIEFKMTSTGTPILMEFNGRFFGSTELSVRAGINLPVLFLRQFIMGQEIPTGLPVKNVEVRFFHDELILFTSYLFQKKFKRFFHWSFDVFTSIFRRKHYFETTIFRDPGFSLAFYWYEWKRWRKKWKTKSALKKIRIKPISRADIMQGKQLTFFCKGNICRSPFAEGVARQLYPICSYSSLGSISKELRLSPLNAELAAKEYGVDLSVHRSRCISTEDMENTDLFVVMDKHNYLDLVAMGVPNSKIRFLAQHELKDPYKKSLEEFKNTYRQIKDAMEKAFTDTGK